MKFKPFKQVLRNVRPGPLCLRCSEPIDVRPRNPRPQRQGWLHTHCEQELALARFAENVRDFPAGWSTARRLAIVCNRFGVEQGRARELLAELDRV